MVLWRRLCEDKGLAGEELVEKLASIEYEYDAENVISSYKEFPAMMGRN